MTKEELIINQALDLASSKQAHERNEETIKTLRSRFTSIGQPLNDNILDFNNNQLYWCQEVLDLIDELEY